MSMLKISGGAWLGRILAQEGVKHAFGIVDGTYLGFLKGMQDAGIQLIGPRHETSAAHMAGAYARLHAGLGVCFASNGPGVANILPGIAVENAEGNRVLVITSSRRSGIAYPDRGGTYQYFNQTGVIKAMAKFSVSVASAERLPELTRRALRYCWQGRPGVVHLDVPENIMNTKGTYPDLWPAFSFRVSRLAPPDQEQIDTVLAMLRKAKKPLIHAGSGVLHANASEQLAELAELSGIPVSNSWAARGVLDERNTAAIPMIHVELYNYMRNQADLVLILGSRMGETDWWMKAPNWSKGGKLKVIQVDTDEQNVAMHHPVDEIVIADVREFLLRLNQAIQKEKSAALRQANAAWLKDLKSRQKKDREKLDRALLADRSRLQPAVVVHTCREHFADDSIFVFDGGNTAVWSNFYTQIRHPNSVLSTYKMGMLGAGVAQALGAAVACPNRAVCCLIGDGAFGFHPQELETAIRHQLKVVYVVFVDRQWGMVKMTQQFAFKPLKTMIFKSLGPGETINADFNEIRYDLLAESMGAAGYLARSESELKAALEATRSAERAAVIHVEVDAVQHMWAPGLLHFKAMHQEPAG
ncbi:MAG: thiamine pyrophosphate-binding protein [Leptospiraceae bacterium]|nr:thiamine pyrophosphate-binding protein [Leptospiraceae bacterium]